MTEERIIEIIKFEAHKSLIIVDEGTDSYNDYVIRGIDEMAKSLVKLFTMPDIVWRSEQLKTFREWTRENLDEKDIVTQEAVDSYLESI